VASRPALTRLSATVLPALQLTCARRRPAAAAGRALSSAELTLWVDELSSCLGLLINLVEHDTELRGRMRGMRLPASAPGAEAEGVVALLSTLMAVAASQPNAGGG
jgi:hypothetical protein